MSAIIPKHYSLHDLPAIARQLLAQYATYPIWLFDAPMGTGKTTLIKNLCQVLSTIDDANSPTYSLINEYHTHSSKIIYHIDLYRLQSLDEALHIGIEDYLYQPNAYCFIEWYQIIAPILPPNCLKLHISLQPNGKRQLKATII